MVYLLQQVINLGLKISWWEPIDPSTIDESILSCVFPYWPLVTFFHALSALIPNQRIHPLLWYLGSAWPSLALWKKISWFCLRGLLSKKNLAKFYHTQWQTWMSLEVSGMLGFTHTSDPTRFLMGSCMSSLHLLGAWLENNRAHSGLTRGPAKGPQCSCSQIIIVVLLGWQLQAWKMNLLSSLEHKILIRMDGKMRYWTTAHPSVLTPVSKSPLNWPRGSYTWTVLATGSLLGLMSIKRLKKLHLGYVSEVNKIFREWLFSVCFLWGVSDCKARKGGTKTGSSALIEYFVSQRVRKGGQ